MYCVYHGEGSGGGGGGGRGAGQTVGGGGGETRGMSCYQLEKYLVSDFILSNSDLYFSYSCS